MFFECHSVTVTYGKKIRALSDVSLSVKEGEIIALIGANGSGKSTFLKTISGLHRMDSGTIYFQDRPIHSCRSHEISGMGIAHVPEG